jgi:hypothetical protein
MLLRIILESLLIVSHTRRPVLAVKVRGYVVSAGLLQMVYALWIVMSSVEPSYPHYSRV